MSTLEVILSVVTMLLTSGGLATIVTMKYQRKQAKNDSMRGQADLAEEILEKYLKSVSAKIDDTEAERRRVAEQDTSNILERLDSLQTTLQDVVEYLNGPFANFQHDKHHL